MTKRMISAFSRSEIKQKIDDFLADKPVYAAISLILPVNNARRFKYKGLVVREWSERGNTRYDTAVDVMEKTV